MGLALHECSSLEGIKPNVMIMEGGSTCGSRRVNASKGRVDRAKENTKLVSNKQLTKLRKLAV